MKKSLILSLLLVAAVAVAQQSAPPSAQAGAGTQPGAAASPKEQKTINNPVEYKAYIDAVQETAPAQKATSLESFLQNYPDSVMKQEAAALLLNTYYQMAMTDPKYKQKVIDTGERVLQIDPNNLTALALIVSSMAQGDSSGQMLQQERAYAERGLQQLSQPKPEGYTDEQWDQYKQQFRFLFLRTIGQAALQAKDYVKAQQDLKDLVVADPNNFNSVYLLALAYLEPNPPDPQGLFWIARAVSIAPPQLPPTQLEVFQKYGKSKYARYHGSEDGWDQILAMAKTSPSLPPNFSVTPAPSVAEQAGMLLQKNKPEEMAFADWQFILSSGNQPAADQVWNDIQGKPINMVAQVIAVSGNTLHLAASLDDIKQNRADIELTLAAPPAPGRSPKPGTEITVQGVPSSYIPNPFMMRMSEGRVIPRAGTPQSANR